MHLPQIVADFKYRRKIAEKVFSPELLGVRSISEILPACRHRQAEKKDHISYCYTRYPRDIHRGDCVEYS